MNQQIIICYVPVIHSGYLELFDTYPRATIAVLGDTVLKKRFDYLRKDVRALRPDTAAEILSGMKRTAIVLEENDLVNALEKSEIIMPDDDISHNLVEEFNVTQAVFAQVFLRWDRKAVDTNQTVQPDRTIELPAEDKVVTALYEEASKSTNWWRNVAAAIVENGAVQSVAHNSSVPTEYSSTVDGDPRITASRGANIDTSVDIHAEARLIGGAAKQGEKLAGTSLYVTTFPCPTCAKLISASGIRHCYFVDGYATIDGQSILKANGIEIIKIESTAVSSSLRQKPREYPTN
jgi:dCMP deaminase